MKFKRLIPKFVVVVLIIATAGYVVAAKLPNFEGIAHHNFRSPEDSGFSAHPNPFEDFTVITVKSDTPVYGTLHIEDGNQKVVTELYKGIFSGSMNFVWDGTRLNGDPLEPGTYTCYLNTGGNRYTSRTIILILK